jgi:hypothetical protein
MKLAVAFTVVWKDQLHFLQIMQLLTHLQHAPHLPEQLLAIITDMLLNDKLTLLS